MQTASYYNLLHSLLFSSIYIPDMQSCAVAIGPRFRQLVTIFHIQWEVILQDHRVTPVLAALQQCLGKDPTASGELFGRNNNNLAGWRYLLEWSRWKVSPGLSMYRDAGISSLDEAEDFRFTMVNSLREASMRASCSVTWRWTRLSKFQRNRRNCYNR